MLTINKEEIKKRKKNLENCRKYLKNEFIGIDNIIDSLLDYIQVWYLMPEILSRPVIVNLWGMTGVGKTDLVRKLIKSLHFQDRFAEVELSNIEQGSWNTSVFKILDEHNLNDEKPAVVLFDEIQRFNTKDDDGRAMQQSKYVDFWELLSDGRLSKKDQYDLDYFLLNVMGRKKNNERKKAKGEKVENEKQYLSSWEVRDFKKNLGIDMSLEEMMNMTEEQMVDIILKSKQEKKIYEPVNHSKTLILISGNLDEAFQMANQTSEADIDADIFHAFTEKITMVDIKDALSKKFRPEQVARFGNIHLIYTSLKKVEFELLIKREIARIVKDAKDKLGLELSIHKSINDLIYRNGVFPVQGVRPVFSSVNDILETNLSKYAFEAIMDDKKSISIKYDEKNQQIIAKVGKQEIKTPFVGRIDKIRNSNEVNTVANISVHESGHAVVYMLLMGLVPLQLKSKIASSYAGGFTFPHQIHETRENIINKVKIYLAGGIAEEILFGKEHASIGRSKDRQQATMLVVDYVRKYGFDEEFQSVYTIEDYPYTLDKSHTDLDIEKMTARMLAETKELLIQNIDFLKEMSIALAIKGTMEVKEIAKIAKKFKINVSTKEEGYLHIAEYNKIMKS